MKGDQLKVKLWKDEWYPIYGLSSERGSFDLELDIPEAMIVELKEATERFEAIQDYIDNLRAKKVDELKPTGGTK